MSSSRLASVILGFAIAAIVVFGPRFVAAQDTNTTTTYQFMGVDQCDTVVTVTGWNAQHPVSIAITSNNTEVGEMTITGDEVDSLTLYRGAMPYIASATFDPIDEYAFTYIITLEACTEPVEERDWFEQLADQIPYHPDMMNVDADYLRELYNAYIEVGTSQAEAMQIVIDYTRNSILFYDATYGADAPAMQTAAAGGATYEWTVPVIGTPSWTATPIPATATDVPYVIELPGGTLVYMSPTPGS